MMEGRLRGVELGLMGYAVDIATALVIAETGKWISEEGREMAQIIKLGWSKRTSDGMVDHRSVPRRWRENCTEGGPSQPHPTVGGVVTTRIHSTSTPEPNNNLSESSYTSPSAEFRDHWSRRALEEGARAKRRAAPLRHRPRPRPGEGHGPGSGAPTPGRSYRS